MSLQPFTEDEVRDIILSTLGLGFAFAILFFGNGEPFNLLFSVDIIPAMIVSTIIVAVSFVPHEMAHRAMARGAEAYAEYEMWTPGVVIAILTAFLGIVMAAPGGVKLYLKEGERYGRSLTALNPKNIGFIALSGPLMNLSAALLFLLLEPLINITVMGENLIVLGAFINSYLALFNLLPFRPLDGYKVLRWSTTFWAGTILLSLAKFLLIIM